jgi:hypothetical protein
MQAYTWFFSLSTPLSAEQEVALQADFANFANQWKSHGTPVEGLIQVKHKRFVIAQSNPVDSRPSGCSIDSLKRGIEQILRTHQLPQLDSSQVFYRDEAGEIQFTDFRSIPELVAQGKLQGDTLIFDHSLSQSDDLSKWEVPLAQSWLRRYLSVKQ